MTNKHLWPHPTLEEQFEALYAKESEIMNTLRQAHQSLSVLKDSMLPKFSAEVANVVRLSIMQRDNAEQERNQAMIIVGEQKAALIKAEWNATQARVTAEQARATLRALMNESAAMITLAEPAMREAVGHTNVACLQERIQEAEKLLAAISAKATK